MKLFSAAKYAMKFCYRLNLPPLDHILNDSAVSMLGTATEHPRYISYNPVTIFKHEWLTINGFKFDGALYFYKPPQFVGRVHTDVIDPQLHVWGINWIYGASGLLNFWDPATISPVGTKIDEQGYPILIYPTDIPPDRCYHMEPGAYLVSTRWPHQPVSFGYRHCISARCTTSFNTPWENIVDAFSEYIE